MANEQVSERLRAEFRELKKMQSERKRESAHRITRSGTLQRLHQFCAPAPDAPDPLNRSPFELMPDIISRAPIRRAISANCWTSTI